MKEDRKRERLVNRDEPGVIAKSIGKSDQAACNEREKETKYVLPKSIRSSNGAPRVL